MKKLKFLFIGFFCSLLYFSSSAQLVITVAGQAETSGNVDGQVFEALFHNPHGIAIDKNGYIYTVDRWSHCIRKIMPDIEQVVTVAGNPGVSGDQDGVGSEALFNEPWGLCIDNYGNILVADTRNNKIRKVTPDGTVTTLAGSGNFGTSSGNANFSTFGNPTGIEVDSADNIYVADHLTHIIRKITPDGTVSTIAGIPYLTGANDGPGNQATFHRPYGLHVDADGSILVADEWNHKIRRVGTDGQVTTVAGDGTLGGDDGTVVTASFNYPWDMTVDSTGNIFVADGYNYTIRKITPDGLVTTFVGSLEQTGATDGFGTAATFSGATSIAFNSLTKELFVGDAYNDLVRKIVDLNQGLSLYMMNSQAQLCESDTLTFNASPAIYDQYDFFVDEQLVQSGAEAEFKVSGLSAGNHVIKVIIEDDGNAVVSNTIGLSVLPSPEPNITAVGETTIFEGDSVTLVCDIGSEWFWSSGEDTQTITVFEGGTFTVEVLGNNGCYGTSEPFLIQQIATPDAPVITLDGELTLCAGDSTLLFSNYEENNRWFRDGWPIDDAEEDVYVVKTTGAYQLEVTSDNGTTLMTDPILINVLEELEADFEADITTIIVENEVSFAITGATGYSYLWDFGDPDSGTENTSTSTNPTHAYSSSGTYTITLIATDSDNCSKTIQKENYIIVQDEDAPIIEEPDPDPEPEPSDDNTIFIPNAFSPNGDGENDIFRVRGANLEEVTMRIFNQWGELVFESYDQTQGWDGLHNGKIVQNGTYTYMARIKEDDGNLEIISGHITVIR